MELPQTSEVRSRGGAVIGRIFQEDRVCIKLGSLPPHITWAFVSAEDKRFFRHRGVDPIAVLRAGVHNLRALRVAEGGSTITQQLVRNALMRDTRRTIRRKLKEMVYAVRVERAYSKHQILEAYLNAIWFGHGVYGLRNASVYYFGIEPHELNLNQAACLSGLIRAPGKLSPRSSPALARRRRNHVLRQMQRNRYITSCVADSTASAELSALAPDARDESRLTDLTNYYLDGLRDEVRRNCPQLFPMRRLTVEGTLDGRCQEGIARTVRRFNKATPYRRLVMLVSESRTGSVLGVVNGSAYTSQQFNIATRGRLQPGSTIKPFVLAAALKHGLSPATEYDSEPVSIPLEGGERWEVRNYGEVYRGRITLAEALAHSDNCVFARLAADIGLPVICEVLDAVGLRPTRPTLAVSLGAVAGGVSPMQMAAAYSVFANRGRLAPPKFFTSLTETETGRRIVNPTSTLDVLDPAICDEVDEVLRLAVMEGTGAKLRHFDELRAKTGTTDQGSWTVSYDPFFQTVAWVEEDVRHAPDTLPPKARTAIELTKRVRDWLSSRAFLAEFWGVLRGYWQLTDKDKHYFAAHFASNS